MSMASQLMIRRFAAFVCAVLGMASAGAADITEGAAARELQELADVWGRGERLSKDIETAENEFFQLFNRSHRKIGYDIYCRRMKLNPGNMSMDRTCIATSLSNTGSGSPNYSTGMNSFKMSNSSGPPVYPTLNPGSCIDPCRSSTPSSYSSSVLFVPPDSMTHYSDKLADNLLKLTRPEYSNPPLFAKAQQLEVLYAEMQQVRSQYVNLGADEEARAKAVRKLARPSHPGDLH